MSKLTIIGISVAGAGMVMKLVDQSGAATGTGKVFGASASGEGPSGFLAAIDKPLWPIGGISIAFVILGASIAGYAYLKGK